MTLDYIEKTKAEEITGMKLDGRRKYFIWFGTVCVDEKYTSVCSGCGSEDPYVSEGRGSGCEECGYTGKRVNHFPCPVNPKLARI